MSVIDRLPTATKVEPSTGKPSSVSRMPAPMGAPAKSKAMPIVITALALAALGAGAYWFLNRAKTTDPNTILTRKAELASFDVKIPLTGELRAIKSVEIRSQVETNTTIVKIVDEGKFVNEGDVLVELASDQIRDKLEEVTLRVENDKAAVTNAQSALEIQTKQNASDQAAAQSSADIAKKDWDQFSDPESGDAKIAIDTLNTAKTNAQADRDRKAEDLRQARDLFKQKYISSNDVLDAEIALRDAENKLQTATANLELWNKYQRSKQEMTLKRKMDITAADLVRTIANGISKIAQCEQDLASKKSTLKIDTDRMEALQKQLAACTIKAPQPGMVVYQSSVNNYWGDNALVQQGMSVNFNRPLIQLPDTSYMMAEVRLAEQLFERVKIGQEVIITVDAVPGKVFRGKVATVAPMADGQARWSNSNIKEFVTRIPLEGEIDQTQLNMKPGMTAKCEIIVKRAENVVTVPTQAVFKSGEKTYVFSGTAANWKRVPVVIGAVSPMYTQIVDGVKVGDEVLLSRPPGSDDERQEKSASTTSASSK